MFKSKRLSNKLKSVKVPEPKLGNSNKTTSKLLGSNNATSKLFNVTEVTKYGMTGKITKAAFDNTQSLLAVATNLAEVHVFGKQQIEVTFQLENKAPVKDIRFVKGIYLVVIDAKDVVLIYSLYSKELLTTFFTPGKITCIDTDPSLDWMLIGLQSGTVLIYDIDRDNVSEFNIENLQKSYYFPRDKLSPVVSIQWNPRDIGTILISYEWVTVTYSLVEAAVKKEFIYELQPFAPGGEFSTNIDTIRRPKVIQSLYHPNSLHILTVHDDNSLVFWDANTGKLIQARTLFEVNIQKPQVGLIKDSAIDVPKIKKVAWMCGSNPEYTSLLITYGPMPKSPKHQSLSIWDLGGTPLYTLTSYDGMSKYYSNIQNQKLVPMINKSPIVDFVPIARQSPYFSGCHDPGIVLLVLEDGELATLLYPLGVFTSKASLFPQSLAWVRPQTTKSVAFSVHQNTWLGMRASAKTNDYLLKGGKPAKRPPRVNEIRSALATGHINGHVRLWDASHRELDNSVVFEISAGRILNRSTHTAVDNISFAPDTLEIALSVETGTVILLKYEINQFYNLKGSDTDELEVQLQRFSLDATKSILVDVRNRAPRNVRQDFMPSTVVNYRKGRVTALCNSNIGFVSVGYEEGSILVVDRRGPAVIYLENIRSLSGSQSAYVTKIEFGIMEYGNDGYSSILMFCGTDIGELLTFKIFPEQNGRFKIQYVETMKSNDKGPILNIDTLSKYHYQSCYASVAKMKDLSKGIAIPGYVITTGNNDIRTLTPGKSKEQHKTFKFPLAASGSAFIPYANGKAEKSTVPFMISLQVDGTVKVFSVPELKEVTSQKIPVPVSSRYIVESSILKNGDIMLRTGSHEASLISVVNELATGLNKAYSSNMARGTDILYNPGLKIRYRPQVNTLQWARGTSYCAPEQLDAILGGERRPPSKFKESAIATGTLATRPDEEGAEESVLDAMHKQNHYVRPSRAGGKSAGYSSLRSISRAVENQWDNVETSLNEYATVVGQSMNDAIEETSKDMVKGALGF